jgi:hypothetical protein
MRTRLLARDTSAVKYVVGAGAIVTGALIALVAVIALRPGSSSDHASSGRRPEAFRVAAASLKDSYEISVVRARPSAPTGVSRLEARRIATKESRMLGGELEDAHLVYFPDPHYGKERRGRPIVPFFKHRLSWLVLFRHGTEVLIGPPGGSGATPTAAVGVAAFVDAKTGAFLTTITINDLP